MRQGPLAFSKFSTSDSVIHTSSAEKDEPAFEPLQVIHLSFESVHLGVLSFEEANSVSHSHISSSENPPLEVLVESWHSS